ncbi:MAG: AAA family ATPase, partial [Myxococcota bacterium]
PARPAAVPARPTSSRGTPPADLVRVRDAFRQLAEAVHALHVHGRLHRDLKPTNVLVEPSGRVVLLDFGLVAAVTPTAGRGPVVGTVPYMSPEQAAGAALTAASDWYAFGTMLFEALTGERPFTGTLNQVLADKQHLDAPDPSEACDDLPDDLASLCRSLLVRDPAARPAGVTVVQALGGAADDTRPDPGLVGRRDELAALGEAWDRVTRGQPGLVTIRGRSGIGKTALAEAFVRGIGAQVLAGRCYERESVPFKALDALVDALSERLGAHPPPIPELDGAGELFPVLRRPGVTGPSIADAHERRARGFRGLQRLIASLAPLVVYVDDAQWGDPDSAVFFTELLATGAPVLVLFTWRTEEEDRSPFLRALLRAPGAVDHTRLDLDHLAPDDCRALARELLPAAGDDTIDAIARASGGHPLFVHELARTGRDRVTPAGDLDEAIRLRVAALPASSRRALEAVAAVGRPISAATLAAAVGAEDLVPELAVLRGGRLIRTSGTSVEPFHDRVREAVTAGLSPAQLGQVHRRLAEAVEGSADPDPEALAIHWRAAGEPARALPYATAAADRAHRSLAFDHAARLYGAAVEACADPALRRTLALRHGAALAAAGRPVEAADVWLAVPELPVATACLAGEQLLAAGHVERGLATVEAAAIRSGVAVPRGVAGMTVDLVARRALLTVRGLGWTRRTAPLEPVVADRLAACWAAVDGLAYIDPLRMAAYQARLLPLALRSGDPTSVARALLTEAGSTAFAGGSAGWARAQRLLDEAGSAVAASDDPSLPGLHRYSTAMLAYHQHRFDEAAAIARECEQWFLERCAEAAWHVARTRMLQCWCHIWRGRLAVIAEVVPRLVKDAEERGNLYLATSLMTDIGYILGMVRDDVGPVWDALDARETWWTPDGFHLQHLNLGMSRIQLVGYRGDAAEAFRLADDLFHRWRRSVLVRGSMFVGLVHQLRARAALGLAEVEPARRAALCGVARETLRSLAGFELPQAAASLKGIEARIHEVEGDLDGAVARLREAVAGLDATGIVALAQSYRRHLGRLVGGDEGGALVAR